MIWGGGRELVGVMRESERAERARDIAAGRLLERSLSRLTDISRTVEAAAASAISQVMRLTEDNRRLRGERDALRLSSQVLRGEVEDLSTAQRAHEVDRCSPLVMPHELSLWA